MKLLRILIFSLMLPTVTLATDQMVLFNVQSDSSAALAFKDIIERCTGRDNLLSVRKKLPADKKEQYEIILNSDYVPETDCKRERLFAFFVTTVLAGKEPLSIRIVNGSSAVLIGDIRKSTIDLEDILSFDELQTHEGDHICAGQVLFHELYELHHLVHLQNVLPKKASRLQLAKAHSYATQKEANLYADYMEKVSSEIHDDSIFIKFANKLDNSYTIYYAYHNQGNIYKIATDTGMN